jgi:hypothetical protein
MMAHFAELDENNIVLRVLVVNNEDCLDENGQESEAVGAQFLNAILGGTWKQTSYNATIRYNYAGEGFTYDEVNDAFIAPKPFPSWVLNDKFRWEPPVPRPTEGQYVWDESVVNWAEVPAE